MNKCPQCGHLLVEPDGHVLSKEALLTLNYMRREASKRGGYMYEGARPSFENGTYKDSILSELLNAEAILAHEDPNKGWVVAPAWCQHISHNQT